MSGEEPRGRVILRRSLQVITGLLTIFVFIEGMRSPEFMFDVTDGTTLTVRIAAGLMAAFVPGVLFGLCCVRWQLKDRSRTRENW